MTTCAVMVARDEADIIEPVIAHTLWHVDHLIVADHRSLDETPQIIEAMRDSTNRVDMVTGPLVQGRGFPGDRIWTWLAGIAFAAGHEWLLVVDADDLWHVEESLDWRIADYLADMPDDVLAVRAHSFNHRPTAKDPVDLNPLIRMGWREPHLDAHKTACRLRPDLEYKAHNAWYGDELAIPTRVSLTVRHFTIRTPSQLLTKIRNGLDTAVVSDDPEFVGGWDQWQDLRPEDITARFWDRYWHDDPAGDGLIYDPAPVKP